MGFGRGLLKDPRRLKQSFGGDVRPFGGVILLGRPAAVVITPEGTPPFPPLPPEITASLPSRGVFSLPFASARRPDEPWLFPHESRPFGIVPPGVRNFDIEVVNGVIARVNERGPHCVNENFVTERTMISDARDLLVQTLYERTAIRDRVTGEILHEYSPILPCEVEGSPTGLQRTIFSPPGYIHVGRTRRAEQLLRERPIQAMIAAQNRDQDWAWDYAQDGLDGLDADGFVIVVMANTAERHLILAGATERATYYAVATFLHEHAGTRWLFPGTLGTVIPRNREFILGEAFFQVEEPHYRGRSLAAMVDGSLDQTLIERATGNGMVSPSSVSGSTPEELNDMRNWLLRNRLHPSRERAALFYRRRDVPVDCTEHPVWANCQSLPLSKQRFLRDESRFPTEHNLSHFFSPNNGTMDPLVPAQMGQAPTRVAFLRDMFPNPARKVDPLLTEVVRAGDQLADRGQAVSCVRPVSVMCRETATQQCQDQCPNIEEIPGVPGTPTIPAPTMVRLLEGNSVGGVCSTVLAERFQQCFSSAFSGQETPSTLRFIPRTFARTHAQVSRPVNDQWAPCLYETRATPAGQLSPFRQTVARDLAEQLVCSLGVCRMRSSPEDFQGEFCESIAFNDGLEVFMCECVACRRSNGVDGYNGQAMIHKGQVIVADRTLMWGAEPQRVYNLIAGSADEMRAWSRRQSGIVLDPARRLGLEGITLMETVTPDEIPRRLDRFALQGLIDDRARPNMHTRRVLDLVNHTARFMEEELQRTDLLSRVQLTFHTYATYHAPPVFEKSPATSPGSFYALDGTPPTGERDETVLHPALTPMITASRDVAEYGNAVTSRLDAPAKTERFFERLRIAPEQSNHHRWSLIAQQTGIYEYMQGGIAPRLYTRRLWNALRRGYRDFRSRLFVAEGVPNMGLDGIRFYEVARLLWNVNENAEEMRDDYCRKLFGESPFVYEFMRNYFRVMEEIWESRPEQERRELGLTFGNFSGIGIMGRIGWITQLDPFLRLPTDFGTGRAPPPLFLDSAGTVLNLDVPLNRLWWLVQEAYRASLQSGNDLLVKRVQYFRTALGLVHTIARVYHPVLKAWTVLEPRVEREAREPLLWVVQRGIRDGQLLPPARDLVETAIREVILRGDNFVDPARFREIIRDPVHRYLASSNLPSENPELAELGLGFGFYDAVSRFFAVDYQRASARRSAFWFRSIKRYIEWWNKPTTRAIERGTMEQRRAATRPTSPGLNA